MVNLSRQIAAVLIASPDWIGTRDYNHYNHNKDMRKMIVLRSNQIRPEQAYPHGTPQHGYTAMAIAYRDALASGDEAAACGAVQAYASAHEPELICATLLPT